MAGVVQDVEFAESGGPTTLIARPPGLRTVSDFSRLAPISGATSDIDEAEAVIGYRLRVPHLGAVLWVRETGAQQDQLTRFTRAITTLAEKLGSGRTPLVIPRDRASVWAWIPVSEGVTLDLSAVRRLIGEATEPPLPMLALGTIRSGLAGFRQTHLEALQAQRVAMIRDDPTHAVTSFTR